METLCFNLLLRSKKFTAGKKGSGFIGSTVKGGRREEGLRVAKMCNRVYDFRWGRYADADIKVGRVC